MRVIELKTTKLDDGGELVYRDVLINTLKIHPRGMEIEEMEKVLRIVGSIRSANGQVALEDADHKYVSERLARTPWSVADAGLLQFINDVRDAPQVDANALLTEMRQ